MMIELAIPHRHPNRLARKMGPSKRRVPKWLRRRSKDLARAQRLAAWAVAENPKENGGKGYE